MQWKRDVAPTGCPLTFTSVHGFLLFIQSRTPAYGTALPPREGVFPPNYLLETVPQTLITEINCHRNYASLSPPERKL